MIVHNLTDLSINWGAAGSALGNFIVAGVLVWFNRRRAKAEQKAHEERKIVASTLATNNKTVDTKLDGIHKLVNNDYEVLLEDRLLARKDLYAQIPNDKNWAFVEVAQRAFDLYMSKKKVVADIEGYNKLADTKQIIIEGTIKEKEPVDEE